MKPSETISESDYFVPKSVNYSIDVIKKYKGKF